jgi:cation transport regulator
MPYTKISDLPESVKHVLPKHAQDIYKEAFNHAFAQYADEEKRKTPQSREQTAHKVAWSAVKKKYHKVDDTWEENE